MLNDLSDRVQEHGSNSLRDRIWRVIFLSDTKSGKAFDIALLWLIGLSVLVVMLDSVESYEAKYSRGLNILEWSFTILFTIEYFVRIWVVRDKKAYLFSFFGIIDLLSIIPSYLMLIPGAEAPQYLVVVRMLRLLRVFRVLKMARHLGEANLLMNAFRASLTKITVFLFFVLAVTTVLGTFMYVIEGIYAKNPGFSSMPQSIYWGIVTISTVGYGDVTPITAVGKIIASVIMLIGYGTLAVPTGIVMGEINIELAKIQPDRRECSECGHRGHDQKAVFCKICGTSL